MPLFKDANNFIISDTGIVAKRRETLPGDLDSFLRRYGHTLAHENFSDPPVNGNPDPKTYVPAKIVVQWGETPIADWGSERLLWANGPAGIGKSALTEACANALEEQNITVAKFFFSRPIGVVDAQRLFPTIACQLAQKIPKYHEELVQRVADDPSVGTKDLDTQFQYLIFGPFHRLSESKADGSWSDADRAVVMIDGLDECDDERGAQTTILQIISDSTRDDTTPLRWAFFSRDEKHIVRFFAKPNVGPRCLLFSLTEDIKRLLLDGFRRINPPFSNPTPSHSTMQALVNASKRNFTLAELFVRFVTYTRRNDVTIEEALDPLLRVIKGAPHGDVPETTANQEATTYLNYFYVEILQQTVPSESLHLARKFLAIVVHSERNKVQCNPGLLMDLLKLDERGFSALRSAFDVVLDTKNVPVIDIDDSFSIMPLFHSAGPSAARQQSRPYVKNMLEGDIVPHHTLFFDFLAKMNEADPFNIHDPTLLRAVFDSCLELQLEYESKYRTEISSWDPTQTLPRLLQLMQWPRKNENADIFLKASAYDRLAAMGFALCYSFSAELGRSLKKFGTLNHKKRIIIQGLIAYEGAPTAYVRYGCSGILRNIRGSLLFRISSDEFQKFNIEKFKKMIKSFQRANVIKPYASALATLRKELSRPKSDEGMQSGLYVLGNGPQKVFWYWEWDPVLRYFQQYETLREEEAITVHQGKRLAVRMSSTFRRSTYWHLVSATPNRRKTRTSQRLLASARMSIASKRLVKHGNEAKQLENQKSTKASCKSSDDNTPDPWGICGDFDREYADGESGSWKEEVEKLLIFAGLFSGVLTPLTLESIHNVREDPAQMTVLLLQTIVHQLDNMTNPQSGAPINLNPQLSNIPQSARQINTLWSLSLVLSLSTVMAGILCLQWIREYSSSPDLPNREDLAIRYLRSIGVKKWYVSRVVATLPLLLVTALLFFLVGFIELLWHDDKTAAIPVIIVAGAAICFFVVTTFFPVGQSFLISILPNYRPSQCPWKSPQSHAFYKLCYPFAILLRNRRWKGQGVSFLPQFEFQGWRKYDWSHLNHGHAHKTYRMMHTLYSLGWVATMSYQHQKITKAISDCLRSLDFGEVAEALEAKGDFHRAELVNNVRADLVAARSVVSKRSSSEKSLSEKSPTPSASASGGETTPAKAHSGFSSNGMKETSTLVTANGSRATTTKKLSRASSIDSRDTTDFARDLVCWQVIGHLKERLERGAASPTLLRLQLDLFFRVRETQQTSQILDCPVDCDNVGFLTIEDRKKTLECIQWMLERNLNCSRSHMNAAYAIIGVILSEGKERKIFATPQIQGMLEEVLLWINKPPSSEDPDVSPRYLKEYRLRLAMRLPDLHRFCWRLLEQNILERYCSELEELVSVMYPGIRPPDTGSTPARDFAIRFPRLAEFSNLCKRGGFD
ncbi:hypothetical protein AN958_09128 [Leucoagaricus sp. SymC.cos]|nr:hypothetical protein AN958_09128 [Leucoagaricus sp. SymC.cos]